AGHIGRQTAPEFGTALRVPRTHHPNQPTAQDALGTEIEYAEFGGLRCTQSEPVPDRSRTGDQPWAEAWWLVRPWAAKLGKRRDRSARAPTPVSCGPSTLTTFRRD